MAPTPLVDAAILGGAAAAMCAVVDTVRTVVLAYTYSTTVATPKPRLQTEVTAFDIKRHSQLGQ